MRALRATASALLASALLALFGLADAAAKERLGPLASASGDAGDDDDEGEEDPDPTEAVTLAPSPRAPGGASADEGTDGDAAGPGSVPPENHRVRPGERWSTLAARHRVSAEALRRLNPGVSSLRPGLKVLVPGRSYPPGRVRYPLTSGPGYEVHKPERAFGTRTTVNALRRAFAAYHARFPTAPPILVHDLSRRGGGRMRPHRSHRTGRDADVWLPKRDERASARRGVATPRSLHLERTWFLVRALVRTGAVEMIFLDYGLQRALFGYARKHGASADELSKIFEYPRRRRRGGRYFSVLNHERGHRDHLHVRFRPDRRVVPIT